MQIAWLAFVIAAAWTSSATAEAPTPAPRTTVTLVSFSDYHSHALPFWSEGRPGQGGIARAVAYLRAARRDPGVLVVSGGDMLNKGTPAWSDEFGCIEWPWLDGLVDAMALGNHDLDYGSATFEECRRGVRFPILSANLRAASGAPYLTVDGKPYLVKQVSGVRIGLFAVAGPDVQRLIRAEHLPTGTRWSDAEAAARDVVAALRDREKVDAVVLIGHQTRADDEALARAVPGIDLVLGSHSHLKSELTTIPGTRTRYLSAYQYLTYLAEARLVFAGTRLETIEGRLVKMDERRAADPALWARVHQLQGELQRRRPELFARVGHALGELGDAGVTEGECALGNWVADALRRAADAQALFISASSFRRALPPGPLTLEDLHSALPYTNKLVTADMAGARLLDVLRLSVARRGSNDFSQVSGLRYTVRDDRPVAVRVLKDGRRPGDGDAPLDPAQTYRVATIDYQATFLDGYKQLFQSAGTTSTTLDVHDVLRAALAEGPMRGALDGRTGPR